MLEIGVLGEVRAHLDGRRLDLGGPRQRAVLALLVAANGAVVPTDRFVEDLWAGEPPPRATGALQAYVSHLRRVLEPDRAPRRPAQVLVSATPGYRLELPVEAVDAWHHVALVAAARRALDEGDPEGALTHLAAARSRWAGPPYAASADQPWAAAEVDRLVATRASAAEIAGAAAIAVGRPDDALADLEAVVRDDPLRERTAAVLARTLAAAGRQGDALAVVRATRERLVDELGVDPGADLRAAESAVLAGEAAPSAGPDRARGDTDVQRQRRHSADTSGAPAASANGDFGRVEAANRTFAAPGATTFLGRSDERARLHRAARATAGGRGAAVAWVEGAAGSGKSALLEQVATELGDGVLRAQCSEVDGAPPGWAWRDLLARHTGSPPEARDAFTLTGELASALRGAVRDGLAVLVVEDVHRADGETLQVLRHLVTSSTDPVLVLASFRDDEVSEELARTLALLAGRTADRIALGGLDAASARTLLRRVVGRELPEGLWRALVERAAGHALFLGQLGRLVASEGVEVAARGVPAGVRELIDRRVERLPARAVATLTRAAVLGRDTDVDLLLAVDALRGGLADDDLLDDLDTGVVAGLLVEAPDTGLRFAHALIRDTFAERTPPLRRARLHLALLDVLERDHPDRIHALAHHAEVALSAATAPRALAHLARGARDAREAGAVDDAVRWWRAVLRAHDLGGGTPAGRVDAQGELVRALAASGDLVAARAERARAVAAAQGLGDLALEARAWRWDVTTLWSTRPSDEDNAAAIARLQELLALIDDRALRADLLLALAHECEPWNLEIGRPAAVEALALAREIGDPRLLCRALNVEYLHTFAVPDPDHHRRTGEEMLALAVRASLPEHRALAHLVLSAEAVGRGALDGARRHLDDAAAVATGGQLPVLLLSIALFEATLDHVRGRTDAARAAFDDLTARLAATGDPNGRVIRVWSMTTLAVAAGDASSMLGELEEIAARDPAPVAVLLVHARLDAGQEQRARSGWPLPPLPREGTWLLETALQCLAAARLGDAEVLRRTRSDLAPWRGRLVHTVNGQLVLGPVDLVLARAAVAAGEPREVLAALDRVAALADRIGAPHWRAESEALRDELQVVHKHGE
ncbi:BTAD domain-containing putative transcriptional regulator [Actinomycetospora aeridis]|uniref:BTAD domain-containing putative transcriptional regulator n=1 Tax=Actinomycetospora aeridis TaxID=3129231 RepID=A0ABU8NDK0_9PSEU